VCGTWRSPAGVGRTLSLPERDLWAAEMGAADFFSIYLAAFLQRAAFDCYWVHRPGWLRGLLLARPGNGISRPHCGIAHPVGRITAGELGGDSGDCARGHYLLLHGVASLSPDHRDWPPHGNIVAGGHGNHRMDYFRRADALQCGSCV